ncbi:hypothetical protein PFISCL1PPCAC_6450, partial [Pristionchus fissidentatus]
EIIRRDNFYETQNDPRQQEDVDAVWRNLLPSFFGAPIQCLYSISIVAMLAYGTMTMKLANLVLCLLNIICGIVQTVQGDRSLLGRLKGWRICKNPLVEDYNEFTYLTTSETIAKRGRKQYKEMVEKRKKVEEEKRKAMEMKIEESCRYLASLGIPATFHPHLPLEGPETCKIYDYDLFEKNYLSKREREWYFARWTKEYLAVRVLLDISVLDACEKVSRDLEANGFLDGDECSSKQANLMLTEWMDSMIYQDRMDAAPNTKSDLAFYRSLPDGYRMDLLECTLAVRITEAPVDPKKRRLLDPVREMFQFTAPNEMETAEGVWKNEFGCLWPRMIRKDLPVITRAQEAWIWDSYMKGNAKDNVPYDRIYTDDPRFKEIKGQPFEAALKEIYNLHESHPEGPSKKSINPRKTTLEYDYYVDQKHPDFMGPRTAEWQLPCGPYMRRFFLEETYRPIRDNYFNLLVEQTSLWKNNLVIRRVIREK